MSRTKLPEPQAGATLRRVAEAAGVSVATASRVLNNIPGKATPETVRRVRQVAEQLAYRPLAAARGLRRGVAEMVALLAPNLANPTMAGLAAAIETALRPEGIGVVLADTHDQAALQDEALAATRAMRPRATVLLGAVSSTGLAACRHAGERLLFVARRCPGDAAAPFIGIDDRAAVGDVAQALREVGCRRLGVVHGPMFSSATSDRVAGFVAAAGRSLAPADLRGGSGLDHFRIGAQAASAWVERGAVPDGLMCTSDLIALPVIWGFDGGPLNPWIAPWLSSVALPYEAIGFAVRDWVTDAEGGRSGTILPYSLQRGSEARESRRSAAC
jgi:LacI family transcriptional regulator